MSETVDGFGLPSNLGVIICQKVFDGEPILRVSRDDEGEWQFLCDGDHGSGNCAPKLVCLAEIVKRDPSLAELADLCSNWSASRDAKDSPWTRTDESEGIIRDHIERFGWHVTLIPEDDEGPGFAYSIGLYQSFKQPEVIMFGCPPELMHTLINQAGEEFKAGRSVPLNTPVDKYLRGYPVVFKEVKKSHHKEYFGYGLWYYSGPKFPAIQCCWPDKKGLFPWDRGFDPKWVKLQPVLG